jgi:hypothetical protein
MQYTCNFQKSTLFVEREFLNSAMSDNVKQKEEEEEGLDESSKKIYATLRANKKAYQRDCEEGKLQRIPEGHWVAYQDLRLVGHGISFSDALGTTEHRPGLYATKHGGEVDVILHVFPTDAGGRPPFARVPRPRRRRRR